MSLRAQATEGLLSGFVFGAIDAWNEKVLYGVILGLIAFVSVVALVTNTKVAAYEGESLLEITVYVVAFAVGWGSAHLGYRNAFEEGN